jgi:hypothetical protein
MKRRNKDEEILNEMYRRAFSQSTPKGDWDQILENATLNSQGQKEIPFMDYECEDEIMKKIIDDVLKENKVPKWKRKSYEISFWLGCSPKSKTVE